MTHWQHTQHTAHTLHCHLDKHLRVWLWICYFTSDTVKLTKIQDRLCCRSFNLSTSCFTQTTGRGSTWAERSCRPQPGWERAAPWVEGRILQHHYSFQPRTKNLTWAWSLSLDITHPVNMLQQDNITNIISRHCAWWICLVQSLPAATTWHLNFWTAPCCHALLSSKTPSWLQQDEI